VYLGIFNNDWYSLNFTAFISYDANNCDYQYSNQQSTTFLVNIDELTSVNYIDIFPNPASGILNFKSENKLCELTIFNNLGEQVYFVDGINSEFHELNIDYLPAGIYISSISTSSSTHYIRIQKI
jgi:hypothetical protein